MNTQNLNSLARNQEQFPDHLRIVHEIQFWTFNDNNDALNKPFFKHKLNNIFKNIVF